MSEKNKMGRRYRALIIFIVVFLAILVSVLFLSYQASNQLDKKTDMLDATGEMSDQSYQMVVDLQSLVLHEQGLAEIDSDKALDSLTSAAESFEAILKTLEHGGDYDYGEGDIVSISAVTSDEEKQSIAETKKIWKTYAQLITTAVSAEDPQEKKAALIKAADYGQQVQGDIYDNLDVIYSKEASESNSIAQRAKWTQIAGIALIVVFFILFMLYFLRKLQKADKQTAQAQEETANIMKTVDEGLFLLDNEQRIGSQHSAKISELFGRQQLAGTKLSNLLQGIISDKDLEATKAYIEQLYNSKVKENLVKDLNPLDEIQTTLADANGAVKERYLKFNFSRVYDQKKIESILVSVVDNTRSVLLEKQLQREKEQNDQHVDMLVSILKTDINEVNSFTENTQHRLNKMNEILKSTGVKQADLRQKASTIYREMHSLKGEASALSLETIVQLVHDAEDKLKNLKEKGRIYGEDFLPLTVSVEKLMTQMELITEVNQMLQQRVQHFGTTDEASSKPVLNAFFNKTVTDIAARHNKAVDFNGYSIQEELLTGDKASKVKDIAIQLLGNAIVHGVESESMRNSLGKPPTATVSMQLMQTDKETAKLVVQDDGAGIDFDKIKEKLINKGHSAELVNKMSKNRLLAAMFAQGFSTTDALSEDAGRGVGLDIVAQYVRDLGGKLSVQSEKGKFTRFTIRYPL